MKPEERKRLRLEKSVLVLEKIKELLEKPGKVILPKNKISEAINYTLISGKKYRRHYSVEREK